MTKDALRNGEEVSMTKSMIAGGASGVLARAFTAPLDVLKISAQLKPRNKAVYIHEAKRDKAKPGFGTGSFEISRQLDSKKLDPGSKFISFGKNGSDVISLCKEIFKKDGIPGFFKGNVPGMTMYLLYGSVQFSSYSFFNARVKIFDAGFSKKYYEALNSLIVGGMSGTCACIVTYPLDILKTRFVAVSNKNKSNIFKEAHQIWKYENGILGLFRGCSASIATFAISSSLIFSIYESLKIFTERNNDFNFITPFISAVTGVTAKSVTFPLDTIRRRLQIMQAKNLESLTADAEVFRNYNSKKTFLSIGREIVKTEGVLALYQGLSMGLIKSAPTTAISLSVYQYIVTSWV
ncbi:hypothetical protein QEN19_000049 [Hanseniaspora menglaensis]